MEDIVALILNQHLQEIGMKCLAVFLMLFGGGICVAGVYVNIADGFYYTAILPAILLLIVLAFVRLLWNTNGTASVDYQGNIPEESGGIDQRDARLAAFIFSVICFAVMAVDYFVPYTGHDQRSLLLGTIVVVAVLAAVAFVYFGRFGTIQLVEGIGPSWIEGTVFWILVAGYYAWRFVQATQTFPPS